jgi:hypothetical protein
VSLALRNMTAQLLVDNGLAFSFPEFDRALARHDNYALPLYRKLEEIEPFLLFEEQMRETFAAVTHALVARIMAEHLPSLATDEEGAGEHSAFCVPLIVILKNPTDLIASIIAAVFTGERNTMEPYAFTFKETRQRLFDNLCAMSGITPQQAHATPAKLVLPDKNSGEDRIGGYLANTPFLEFIELPVPFRIPGYVRNEHFLVVARTGSGKTQLIQRDILDNLWRPDSPGMVVIDSQNQMIPKLETLRAARDRIVIVDPFDASPPALNMFLSARPPIADPNLREAIEANTLQQFAWIFSALDQELTGRQTTLFTFTTRILLAMKANMQTFLDFMRIEKTAELKASKFWPFIEATDEQTRYFFDNRFCTNDYNKTKGGVADRLLGVLRVPAFNRMFMASANKLDLYSLLNERKLIVFNTHKSKLGNDASAILGRYAISLYIRAAFERELDIKPPPAFLYVDEASEYFGKKDSTDTLFTQLRKYNCGTFVAFQDLSQLGEQHATLIANTSTKLTGGLSVADARKLAPDMRTSEDELLSIQKRQNAFEFMCYVNNVIPRSIKLTFEYGAVEHAAQLTADEHLTLRERNREILSVRGETVAAHRAPETVEKSSATAEPRPAAQTPTSKKPEQTSTPEKSPTHEIKPGKEW